MMVTQVEEPSTSATLADQHQFHSLRDLAEALDMHYMTILGWARAKKIRTVRLPGERKYRIPHDEWLKIMGQNQQMTTSIPNPLPTNGRVESVA
jgi:excisionase family DNA binding protein